MFARLRRQPHSGRCSKTVRIKRTPETADERFRSLLGRIARVPKAEVEKEEQKYQAAKTSYPPTPSHRPVTPTLRVAAHGVLDKYINAW